MSFTPPTTFRLDLGSLDEELSRTLECLRSDEEANEKANEKANAGPPIDSNVSRENLHAGLALAFVEHKVDDSANATHELIKKIIKEDEKELRKKQIKEQQDKQLAALETIYEVFSEHFDKTLIRNLLKEHNHDIHIVIDRLASASSVPERKDLKNTKGQIVKTVYGSSSPVLFNGVTAKPSGSPKFSPKAKKEPTVEEARKEAEEYARKLHSAAAHHRGQASRFGINDPRSGALSAISRQEAKEAKRFEDEADGYSADKVKESVDLHGYTVDRALGLLHKTLLSVQKRRPWQTKLEVITGYGCNNLSNKPILKIAISEWLRSMNIKFECPQNPGVIMVFMSTVTLK